MWKYTLWAPILLIILFLFVPEEMKLLVQGMIIIGFVISIFIGWYWVQSFRYKSLMLKGQAHASILQGRVIHNTQGTWIESDKKLELVPLHDNPALRINGHERPLTPDERWYRSLTAKVIPGEASQIMNQSTQLLLPPKFNLVKEIGKFDRLLIIGATDSGKTTLLNIALENRPGIIVALDPHGYKGKWPKNVKVVGLGRNFEQITQTLHYYNVLMSKRYEELAQGKYKECEHPKVTIVADEWRAAVKHSKEAAEYLKFLLNEGRKVSIGVILGSQSDRVKALGIEGEGDLKDSFAIVRLQLNKLTKERRATIDVGEGEVECSFDLSEQPATLAPLQLSTKEAQVLSNYVIGDTATDVMKKIYNGKGGGYQHREIKEILNKHGYAI